MPAPGRRCAPAPETSSPRAECRTGLDHLSFGVATRDELAAWMARLDELGIKHTGIRDEQQPLAYSTVVFRDPDNIQLKFIALG
jgi:glyoxylase I family protein